jgi:hypothetical protein
MPITLFIGVRISWLIVATKADLALDASSAVARAARSSTSRARIVSAIVRSVASSSATSSLPRTRSFSAISSPLM